MFITKKKEAVIEKKNDNKATQLPERQKVSQIEIANKAYELYEKKGCQNGQDWDDWFNAENSLT